MAKPVLRQGPEGTQSGMAQSRSETSAAEDHMGTDDDEIDDDDDDNNDDDDDDEEPALRYKRLGGNVNSLFGKDTASTLAACERFLVLGTHWGNVIIIDFEGNEIKQWRAHSATVNSVSIDLDNEYVASAGDDGRVVVHGLYADDITIVDYSRPVKAVAIDPLYSRKSSRRFVSGGTSGQLIMYEKKWYAKSDTILFTSAGPIQGIQWQGSLVAWACDEGVQIYDVARGARISQIAQPEGSPRADLYTCRLHWRDERTLVIGWANFVQLVALKERAQQQVAADSAAAGPSLYAEIGVLFRTDFVVCGVAMYRSQFLVLTYGDHQTVDDVGQGGEEPAEARQQRRARDAQAPELRVINWNIEEVSSDALALEGFPLLQPNDYGLAFCAAGAAGAAGAGEADTWYILSPKQLVSVRPRGLSDHVQWLTERGSYKQALGDIEDAYGGRGAWAAYRSQVKETEYQAIGQQYAQLLMDAGSTAEAAAVCLRVLPRTDSAASVATWESWVFAFAEAGSLQQIAKHIPTRGPQLSSTAYEMVLAFLLAADVAEFRQLVLAWPPALYNAYSVALAAEDRLEKAAAAGGGQAAAAGDRQTLKEMLALLYDRLNQPARSLRYHLELFADGVLERIRRENLFDAVRDKAELVLRYDDHALGIGVGIGVGIGGAAAPRALQERCEAAGAQLLTDNTDAIPCASVVKQLVRAPEHLHVYLHTLLGKDAHQGAAFADLQVELYAEYDPGRLLSFLRISTYYAFDRALEICEERGLVAEMVFVLGRMGDNHRALMLIIERLRDVARAIEFATEQNDPELWRDLVAYARDKPAFIVALLERGGAHTRPTRLIRSIPPALRVPGIRRALASVLHDSHLQVELCADCKHVLHADCEVLSDGLRRLQHQAVEVGAAQPCLACHAPLEDLPPPARSVLAFWCGHAFHDKCILHADVLQKTQLSGAGAGAGAGSGSGSGPSLAHGLLRRHHHRPATGAADRRRALTQAKLDRTMLIRQYAPACPVCAEYDQKKTLLQAHSAWSPAERRDRALDGDAAVPEPPPAALLPPIQALVL